MKTQNLVNKNQNKNSNYLKTISKRSKVMFKSILFAIVALFVIVGVTFSQNLVIQSGSSFTGTGTYNIKGNITNSGVAAPTTIEGTVNLTGADQGIGTATNGGLTFGTLSSAGTLAKTQNVAVTVSTAYTVAGTGSFDVNGQTLNLDGSANRTSGALAASGGGSTVNYRANAGSQTVIDANYTNLILSNAASKSLQGPVIAGTMTHTGGDLTVDRDLTVNTSGTLATLANITAGRTLTFGTGASSINTITAINGTGSLINGSGALTVTNLSGNSGTITSAAGGGTMSFTNAATNGGTITGGAGLVTFSNTLDHGTGTITAGTGGLKFDGVLTINSGTVTAGTGTNLDFNADVAIKVGGTISLIGTGEATFASTFAEQSGTVNLAVGSLWTYDGGDQNVAGGGAGVTYGRLTMAGTGSSKKTALGDLTVNGDFTNSPTITTDMRTFGLTLAAGKINTGATMQFAGLNNGVVFNTGTVEYNGTTGDAATQTVATGTYANLLFTNNSPKNILGGTVSTSSNLGINSGVTVNVQGTGILTVGADLINAGTLNNAGTVNVGE
ncbi:MAG: hypothetical protein C0417_08820 [Chlorobiaceae bacterium]|nr:hypothetical protein [Chlorobiaceae bacterium]